MPSKFGSGDRNFVYFNDVKAFREQNKNYTETNKESHFKCLDAFKFD